MISLETGATFRGKAGTATAITYTLLGDEITTGGDAFKTLAQGQLAVSTGTLYTVPGATQTLIKEIHLANTTGTTVTGVTFYINGTAAANQMNGGFSIPPNGTAMLANNGWVVYDGSGGVTPTSITLSGDVTGSGNSTIVTTIANDAVTNAKLANVATGTFKGRVTAATGDPEDLTGTQATTLLDSATTSLKGLMSANDKLKEDNLWVDVTANATATVLPGNTGTVNSANLATLYAAVPTNTTLYFPPGNYDMNAELTMNRDIRLRLLGAGKGRSIIRSTSTTANMFNQTVAGFYISVEELGFSATVTKTAGAAIVGASNNAYLDVRRCEFTNQFRGIDLSSSAANVGTINECLFTSPASTAGGSQLRIDGAGINMMIQNCTINVTGVDTNGLEIKQCGAIQVSTCDFIGGRNTLLVNATNIISALYFTNCFFDQATFGSTVKFIGTAATSRVKFVQCGITNGGSSGLVALEIAGTGSGTGIPEAIDFMLCDFYNNGFAGTTTGILATGVRGFDLTNCRISGFTVGVDITSFSANGVTNFNIQGCTIGPTENFAANGTGVRINAGSFTYASSSIADNDLSGNTTAPIVQNGNFAGAFICKGNQGLANGPLSFAPTLVTNAAVYLGGLAVPPNSLTTKTRFRITLLFSNAAATLSNTTVRIKWGTAATTGDGNIFALTTTGTAAAGFAKMTFEIAITVLNAATGTSVVHMVLQNGANAATGFHNAALLISNTSTATLNTTTAANFLGLELLGSVTNIHTLQSGTIEVVSQGY